MSQCHVHAVPGRDVPCPCTTALSAPPARELLFCPVSQPHNSYLPNRTSESLLASLHSPSALSIHLSFPHSPSPILATFLSMACVLKRFPFTSPRKLSLTCVKRGFLRTAEPHGTSQLSPCAPLMSQCHVHAVPGSDVPCPTPSHRCPRTFGPLSCTCTRLSLSRVFEHYQHLANSVVVVYISFRKFLLSLET